MVKEQRRVTRNPEQVATVSDSLDLLRSKDSPITRISNQVSQIRANFQVLLSPGDRQFKDLPKRVRLMIVSFLVPMLFAVSKLFLFSSTTSPLIWGLVAAALAVLTYGGMYWGVKGQIRKDSLTSVLPLPSLFVFANVLFVSSVFVGEVNRLYLWGLFSLALITFMVLLYVLSLAVNILNVTLFYTIPLSRLGETVAYLSSLITLFLFAYAAGTAAVSLFATGLWIWLSILLCVTLAFLFALTYSLWRYFVTNSQSIGSFSLGISVLLFLSWIVFLFGLPHVWLAAVMSGLSAYILFGYVIHKEQNTLKSIVNAEYMVLLALMFFAVLWA